MRNISSHESGMNLPKIGETIFLMLETCDRTTISHTVIGPNVNFDSLVLCCKRKQPPSPFYNVVSPKEIMLSSIPLYYAANKISGRYSNIETGKGGFLSNFAQLYSKIVFRYKCPQFRVTD